jgi:hypothetical protein
MEFRKSFFLLFALAGSLVSHIVGGGSFISPSRLLIEIVLIASAMLTLRGREYEGPALALAILMVQSATHFILGGGSSTGAHMLLAHVIGGVLSYQLISNFDRIWADITSLIASLLPALPLQFSPIIASQSPQFSEFLTASFSFTREDISRRGPPCN